MTKLKKNVTKLKKKVWPNFKKNFLTKLKKKCDQTQQKNVTAKINVPKIKIKIVTKFENSNCDKT